jgi:hypothetical protein
MVTIFDVVDIPSWSLCYLINNDDSGLNDDEIAMVDSWLETLPKGFSLDCGSEEEFSAYPEFGLACSTVNTAIYSHQSGDV